MKEIKAHGNRTLLMKGREVGDLIGDLMGHIDVIPDVDLSDMSTRGDEHHAYAVSRRKGKHGIPHYVTRRLGAFKSHEDATAAVKKFHKLDEGTVSKNQHGQTLTEDALKHQLKIASSTLKMSDAGASIMGGMSKSEAAKLIAKHKGPEHAKKVLSQAGHTEDEIKKLLEGKKTDTDIITEAVESYLTEEANLTEAKLKFSPDHYTELKKRVSALADKIPGHVEAVRKSGKFKDLGTRIRFDVLHATKMHQDHDLYANGVNDNHIDSALKSVFKELNIKDS
jgi:hypothetical protein